jgi:hypothetical protein
MTELVGRAVTAVAERASPRALNCLIYACASLIGVATLLLLIAGFRVVILNTGLLLGPSVGVVGFGPVIKIDQLEKLKKLSDMILELDDKALCLHGSGWSETSTTCFENGNVTAADPNTGFKRTLFPK